MGPADDAGGGTVPGGASALIDVRRPVVDVRLETLTAGDG